ncbi:hypothetical protein GCM10010403_27570 [Glycomyces rutgersensis]|uniref:Uncharacterized protein n=1 Tax=Glycomyces rutgersensis TaxID=58115 RepID=A0ABP5SLL5_9ACTN
MPGWERGPGAFCDCPAGCCDKVQTGSDDKAACWPGLTRALGQFDPGLNQAATTGPPTGRA